MSRNRIAILSVVLIGAAALVLVTDEPGNAQMTPGMPKMVTFVLEGNYRVKYSCAFMDKSAEGAKGTVEQVQRIEFHPEYVVLQTQTNDGRLVPVHAIKEMTWEQS